MSLQRFTGRHSFSKRIMAAVMALVTLSSALLMHGSSLSAANLDVPLTALTMDVSACQSAQTVGISPFAQQRSLQRTVAGAEEWNKFSVRAGIRYQVHIDNVSNIQFDLFSDCNAFQGMAVHGGNVEFRPLQDDVFYLHARQTGVASSSSYQLSIVEVQEDSPKEIALSAVAASLQRRALDFLEQMRNSPLAESWDNSARLADMVRVVYRPDMQEAAYYEFPIEHQNSAGAFESAGFIQVTNGEHDYPITHWNVEGLSPTQSLDELAPLGGDTTKFYKLDTLSYAAEYEDLSPTLQASIVSTDVLQLGNLPPKITGMDSLSLAQEEAVYEAIAKPEGTAQVDDTSVVSLTLETSGPDEPTSLSDEPWDSWQELKDNYATSYETFLDRLSDDAKEQWTLAQNIVNNGDGLVKDDVRNVQGLSGQTLDSINVSGAGADAAYLKQEEVKNGTVLNGIKLTVLDQPSGAEGLPVNIVLNYTGGITETVKFVIVANSGNNIYLPLIAGGNGSVMAASAESTTAIHGNWGAWSYWWAGTHGDQRLYDQIQAHTYNNNTDCWSGCGATAWGMLFGWADHQATLGNARWSGRWGIYRANGGYGTNADAPYLMDGGIRNILMEIRSYIGTYCNGGSGWTTAAGMEGAWRYLNGRTGATIRTLRTGGWWIFGTSEDDVRDRAISAIKNGSPVVIGRDSHFPLAYGYAEQSRRNCFLFICSTEYNRWFYVNQGWGGNSNGWVTAKAWFAGEILP